MGHLPPRELSNSSHWVQQELYRGIRGQTDHLPRTWRGTVGFPFLLCFTCYCFRFSLLTSPSAPLILKKTGSLSKYFNVFSLTGNLSLESISSTKSFRWSSPSSQSIQYLMYKHKKIAFIFLIKKKKKKEHTSVLRQTTLGDRNSHLSFNTGLICWSFFADGRTLKWKTCILWHFVNKKIQIQARMLVTRFWTHEDWEGNWQIRYCQMEI